LNRAGEGGDVRGAVFNASGGNAALGKGGGDVGEALAISD